MYSLSSLLDYVVLSLEATILTTGPDLLVNMNGGSANGDGVTDQTKALSNV